MRKEFHQLNPIDSSPIVFAAMVEQRKNPDKITVQDKKIESIMLNVVDEEFSRFNRLNSGEIIDREKSGETSKTLPKLLFLKNFKSSLESNLKIDNDEKYSYAIGDGKRIRPLLVMTGSLINNRGEYGDQLIEVATSVELLHKASIILDDLIDSDNVRSGKTSFYVKYGEEETINYFYKLVHLSQEKFDNVLQKIKINGETSKFEKINSLYTEIINGMSKGCIMDLNKEPKTEEETLMINDLQSSVLIRNSLLLGYVLSFDDIKKMDENIYLNLSDVGLFFGKIFQSFNDAEMFLDSKNQIHLKGNVYSDLINGKKNVVCSKIPTNLRKEMSVEEQLEYIENNGLVNRTIDEINNYVNELNNRMRAIPKSIGKTFLNFLFKKYLKKTFNLHSDNSSI